MPKVSFEFYPPKTDEQRAQLDRTVRKLKAYSPEFVSVTFGAGGSTLSYTAETEYAELRSVVIHPAAHVPLSWPHAHFRLRMERFDRNLAAKRHSDMLLRRPSG